MITMVWGIGESMKVKALYIIPAVIALLLTPLLLVTVAEHVFAHANKAVSVTLPNGQERKVRLVIGHTNEPTTSVYPGVRDGQHYMELIISDNATRLPVPTGSTTLQVDKYYYTLEKAQEVIDAVRNGVMTVEQALDNATEKQLGVRLSPVFGQPGLYYARQIVTEGVYGYRVYGTIDYYGVATISIDERVFCTASPTEGGPAIDTSVLNTQGWRGSYGCVTDTREWAFPRSALQDNGMHNTSTDATGSITNASYTIAEKDVVLSSSSSTSSMQQQQQQEQLQQYSSSIPILQIASLSTLAAMAGILVVARRVRRERQ
ncbi:MAG: hypothetical protein QXI92_04670 [Candidatus Nitrosocaldus sp.]